MELEPKTGELLLGAYSGGFEVQRHYSEESVKDNQIALKRLAYDLLTENARASGANTK